MRRTTIGQAGVIGLAGLIVSAGLAGCSGDGAATADSPGPPVTLTVATFGNFGYDAPTDTLPGAGLYDEYRRLHPNVTIKATVASTSDEAQKAFDTALETGSGAADIQAVGADWLPDLRRRADQLVDLGSVIPDSLTRWQAWTALAAVSPADRLIGASASIGPQAICYRPDLFAQAGLPTDREAVAQLLTGGWETYFAVGDQFMAAGTGAHWYDSNAALFPSMIDQLPNAYIDADGSVVATTNPDVKTLYDQVTVAGQTQSAGLTPGSAAWNTGLTDGAFATMACPASLISAIKATAGADFQGWDMAGVFPGGAVNQGGTYLVIPQQSPDIAAAEALVDWLTQPAQQVAVYSATSNFPANVVAQQDPAVTGQTEPFFNNAPVGQIFAHQAAAVTLAPDHSLPFPAIQSAMTEALNRVDVDQSMSPADSWNQWVADVTALG